MQLNAILEVVIGLVFVWLVISVATMEIHARIGVWLGWRAEHLEKSILSMFKDESLVKKFYEHPLITELAPKDKNGNLVGDKKGNIKKPEYIPNATFAKVACEIIINAGKEGKDMPVDTMSLDQIQASLKSLAEKNPHLERINHYILPNMEKVGDDLEAKLLEYRTNTEGWFNDVMSQASSWYKIRAQRMAFWIGLVVAIFINVDTIHIAQKLWQEPTARAVIVAQAEAEVQNGTPSEDVSFATAKSLNFPIGWTTTVLDTKSCSIIDVIDYQFVIRSAGDCLAITSLPALNNGWGIIAKFFGYLLSAAAAAQGAPFWFDALRKLVNIKSQPAQSSKAE
jgi:hypothetical protein